MNTGLTKKVFDSVAINSSGHIFVGTGDIYRSTDNGESWTQINTGLTNKEILSLAINSSGHIFAGTSGGVFRSIPGDLDNDGDVDRNDLNILLTYRNQPASNCPECDLDGDRMITVLDARKLVLLCTRPRCATQ
jgi:ligand-binding sensor domain-containing protein